MGEGCSSFQRFIPLFPPFTTSEGIFELFFFSFFTQPRSDRNLPYERKRDNVEFGVTVLTSFAIWPMEVVSGHISDTNTGHIVTYIILIEASYTLFHDGLTYTTLINRGFKLSAKIWQTAAQVWFILIIYLVYLQTSTCRSLTVTDTRGALNYMQ